MVLGIPFLFLFSPIMWPDITLPLGSMACPWFPIIHSYSYSSKYEMGFLYMPTNESESQINVLSICLSCDWIIFQPFSSSSHPQDLAKAWPPLQTHSLTLAYELQLHLLSYLIMTLFTRQIFPEDYELLQGRDEAIITVPALEKSFTHRRHSVHFVLSEWIDTYRSAQKTIKGNTPLDTIF